jgi:rhodanese-related sulfurtransferase
VTFTERPEIPTIDVNEAAMGLTAGTGLGTSPRDGAGDGASDGASDGFRAAASAPDVSMPLLVDVRERSEFVQVRAPGAVLYPTSSFLLRFEELPRDRPLHVICHSGSRSAAVTAWLLRNGWTDVHNVAGGMTAWVRAGLATRHGPLAPDEGDLV